MDETCQCEEDSAPSRECDNGTVLAFSLRSSVGLQALLPKKDDARDQEKEGGGGGEGGCYDEHPFVGRRRGVGALPPASGRGPALHFADKAWSGSAQVRMNRITR